MDAVCSRGIFLATGSLFGQVAVLTYEGRLTQGGQPANGTYDLRFTLMDSVMLGNVTGPITNASREDWDCWICCMRRGGSDEKTGRYKKCKGTECSFA